jgi:hypothetical protein
MIKKERLLLILVGLCCATALAGCGKSSSPAEQATEPPSQPTATKSPLSVFDTKLQFVRNGLFTYIWVVSRKDGKPFDKEDGAFLRKHAPQIVDWVDSGDGKRFIAGTNFDLEEGNLELMKKRYVFEDYSGK